MKWFTTGKLFILILFIAIFTMSVREITDNDFWWHLRTGQLIIESGTIPKVDPFSYTNQGKEWITHEWLTEIFIYFLYKLGGLSLLILVFSTIITFSFWLVFLRCQGKPYLTGFVLIIGALATAPTWGVRPQMISLLFASIFLFLLDQYFIKKNYRYLVPLPLLMIIWVNMHASYTLGILIVAIYLFGFIIKFLIDKRRSENKNISLFREILPILIVLTFCTFAVLVNPNGIKMITYPFETLNSASMQTYIQEWFSPNFHLAEWQPLAILFLLLLASALITNQSVSITEIGLVVIFGYAALKSMRHVYFFSIAAIPLIDKNLKSLWKKGIQTSRSIDKYPVVNILLLICILLVAVFRINLVLMNQIKIENKAFPVMAAEWIQNNKPKGKIFNSYNWGGYLIWRLYPEYQVFIDGRADVYGDLDMVRYAQLYSGKGWLAEFQEYDIRVVLTEPAAPIATILINTPGWQTVIVDKTSILMVQN